MVICLERGADLHMAQLMPLPLTVSCFSKIRIGFTFLVPAHPGSPGQRAVGRVCVCGDFRGAQMSGGGKSGHGRHNVLLSVWQRASLFDQIRAVRSSNDGSRGPSHDGVTARN